MSKYQVVISRNETIDLVGLVEGVPAKVDTGAFRSAIHATNVKVEKRDGRNALTCTLLGHRTSPQSYPFETTKFSKVSVTNSFGREEKRYEVQLRVKLGAKVFNTSFTLADRSKNLFPVLIGRKLLKGRFMVDVSTSRINRLMLKKQFGVQLPDDEEDLE